MEQSEMIERLVKTEALSKSNSHRIDKLEETQEALKSIATSVQVMATEQKHTSEKLDEVAHDVKKLKESPGDTWEKIKLAAITAVCSGIIGYILAVLF